MSRRIQDLKEATSLEDQDQFLFFQNSTQAARRVSRGNFFATSGFGESLAPYVTGYITGLSYNLTGDPMYQQYTGFVAIATGYLNTADYYLSNATGYLNQVTIALDSATGILSNQVYEVSTATGELSEQTATLRVATGVLATASGALAIRISEVNTALTGASGVLRSAVTTTEFSLSSASGTLATRIQSVSGEFSGVSGTLRAAVEATGAIVITTSGALATQINTVNANFTGASGILRGAIDENYYVFVDASGALAERIETVNSTFTGASGVLRASIDSTYETFVDASGALANRIDSVNSSMTGASGVIRASIDSNYLTFVNASGALAEKTDTVQAQMTGASGVIRSSIDTNYLAFTNASGALAGRIDTVSTNVNGVSGSVITETSARVLAVSGLSGAIATNWGVSLNNSGAVVGAIKLVGEGQTSTFAVMADKFIVYAPTFLTPNGASTAVFPLMDITTKGIVFGASVSSDNYSAGTNGWRITRGGSAEFNDVLVRGTLQAGSLIKGGVNLGENGDTSFGLILNSQFGIRRNITSGVLTINGGSDNGIQYGAQLDMVGSQFAGNGKGNYIIQGGYSAGMNQATDGKIVFKTSRNGGTTAHQGADRMYIDMNGMVVIQTTSVTDGAPNGTDGELWVQDKIFVGPNSVGMDKVQINANGEVLVRTKVALISGVTEQVSLYSDGTIVAEAGITASSFTSTSSKKYKKNIKNFKNGLKLVNSLRPVSFVWKTKKLYNDFGFIAEEVEQILPNVIGKDRDGNTNAIDYSKLTTVLVKAVQELYLEVEKLKEKKNG